METLPLIPHATFRPAAPEFAFGPFVLHAEPLRLCRQGEEVRLGGRALDLLMALVARPGEVQSRLELEAKVWPYTMVEESSLRAHVAALRRALGDGQHGARYIANVPGRGYSFVATVSRSGAAPVVQAPAAQAFVDNLPTSLTRLIGRDAVVSALAAELSKRRLVSIVGHGGIGKTSLALAVAAQVRQEYPDGVCLVDLAPLTAAHHVMETVVSSLGLPLSSDSPVSELENWLRARRLLLVMDNCEHLLDAVASLLERILKRAPGLVVLATSREPLDAEGEWVHRLRPLEAPPDGQAIDSAAAMGYSAVALLAERAAASLDTFEIGAANVHLAAALCRRLDGVPLAIEFAASRIGLLGLQGVCVQLDDRLRLLGSGRRTALPRHRTLRTLLDWSHDLLSPAQQEVLRRCGVFKSGFTLEGAVAVIADEALPAMVVGDCLLDLLAKSLVRVDFAHAPPSYSLLEITRAYALEKLGADPQRQAVLRRHAQFMVVLVKRGASEWLKSTPNEWFQAYATHKGNYRAALEWCFGPDGDPAIGIALLATDVHPMAYFLGETEYRMRARQALDAIEAGVPAEPIHETRIFCVFNYIAASIGETKSPFERLRALAEQDQDPASQFEAIYQMHAHLFGEGHYHWCEQLSRRCEEVAERCGAPEILHAHRLRALSSHYTGEHNVAAQYAAPLLYNDEQQVPLQLSSWLSRRLSMQIVMTRIFWMQGQGARAMALAADCVREAQGARFPTALSQAICLGALPVALWQGDDAFARALLEQLEIHVARNPQQYWSSWLRRLQQVMALRAAPACLLADLPGAPDAKQLDHLVTFGAWGYHGAAMERWQAGVVGWNGPELLRIKGELLLRAQDSAGDDAAEAMFEQALALAEQQHAHAWALRATNSLARLRMAQGQPAQVRALLVPWIERLDAFGDSADARETRSLLGMT